jgi:hypothetical protein
MRNSSVVDTFARVAGSGRAVDSNGLNTLREALETRGSYLVSAEKRYIAAQLSQQQQMLGAGNNSEGIAKGLAELKGSLSNYNGQGRESAVSRFKRGLGEAVQVVGDGISSGISVIRRPGMAYAAVPVMLGVASVAVLLGGSTGCKNASAATPSGRNTNSIFQVDGPAPQPAQPIQQSQPKKAESLLPRGYDAATSDEALKESFGDFSRRLRGDFERAKTETDKSFAEFDRYNAQRDESLRKAQEQNEGLTQRLGEARRDYEKARKDSSAEISRVRTDMSNLTARLTGEISGLRNQLETVRGSNAVLGTSVQQYRNQVTKLEGKNKRLETERKKLETEVNGYRAAEREEREEARTIATCEGEYRTGSDKEKARENLPKPVPVETKKPIEPARPQEDKSKINFPVSAYAPGEVQARIIGGRIDTTPARGRVVDLSKEQGSRIVYTNNDSSAPQVVRALPVVKESKKGYEPKTRTASKVNSGDSELREAYRQIIRNVAGHTLQEVTDVENKADRVGGREGRAVSQHLNLITAYKFLDLANNESNSVGERMAYARLAFRVGFQSKDVREESDGLVNRLKAKVSRTKGEGSAYEKTLGGAIKQYGLQDENTRWRFHIVPGVVELATPLYFPEHASNFMAHWDMLDVPGKSKDLNGAILAHQAKLDKIIREKGWSNPERIETAYRFQLNHLDKSSLEDIQALDRAIEGQPGLKRKLRNQHSRLMAFREGDDLAPEARARGDFAEENARELAAMTITSGRGRSKTTPLKMYHQERRKDKRVVEAGKTHWGKSEVVTHVTIPYAPRVDEGKVALALDAVDIAADAGKAYGWGMLAGSGSGGGDGEPISIGWRTGGRTGNPAGRTVNAGGRVSGAGGGP